jgi:hypothetical protein
MQVANDRWASVSKNDKGGFNVAISGTLANDSNNCPFTVTLYKRWFAMGEDMGRRKLDYNDCNFQFTAPSSASPGSPSGTPGSWMATIKTPGPAWLTHYRILIEEWAYPQPGKAKCGNQAPLEADPKGSPASPKMLSMFVDLR